MYLIDDIDHGVLDRFLVTPVSRGSLIWGRMIQFGLVAIVQSAIILLLGLAMGARFPGGWPGVLVLVVASMLLGTGFVGLSSAVALLARREETMVAACNFVLLPLTFLSSVFMAQGLMPGWMQAIARYNPVNWAVEPAREALTVGPDWSIVWLRLAALLVFMVVSAWLAARAFRVYQKSI